MLTFTLLELIGGSALPGFCRSSTCEYIFFFQRPGSHQPCISESPIFHLPPQRSSSEVASESWPQPVEQPRQPPTAKTWRRARGREPPSQALAGQVCPPGGQRQHSQLISLLDSSSCYLFVSLHYLLDPIRREFREVCIPPLLRHCSANIWFLSCLFHSLKYNTSLSGKESVEIVVIKEIPKAVVKVGMNCLFTGSQLRQKSSRAASNTISHLADETLICQQLTNSQ